MENRSATGGLRVAAATSTVFSDRGAGARLSSGLARATERAAKPLQSSEGRQAFARVNVLDPSFAISHRAPPRIQGRGLRDPAARMPRLAAHAALLVTLELSAAPRSANPTSDLALCPCLGTGNAVATLLGISGRDRHALGGQRRAACERTIEAAIRFAKQRLMDKATLAQRLVGVKGLGSFGADRFDHAVKSFVRSGFQPCLVSRCMHRDFLARLARSSLLLDVEAPSGGFVKIEFAGQKAAVKIGDRLQSLPFAVGLIVEDSVDSWLRDSQFVRERNLSKPGCGLDLFEHLGGRRLHGMHPIRRWIDMSMRRWI
jgi:hypothetical protein